MDPMPILKGTLTGVLPDLFFLRINKKSNRWKFNYLDLWSNNASIWPLKNVVDIYDSREEFLYLMLKCLFLSYLKEQINNSRMPKCKM